MTGGVVTYKLYDENNQAVEIPNYSGSGGNSANGQVVPIGTDVLENGEVNLKLSQHTEGKYYMTIEGYDEAKNYGEVRVDNILLDNKAPVATIKSITQKQETGRVKRIDFEFDISDAFGNGWVYYCFVKEGENVPDKGDDSSWPYLKKGKVTTASLQVEKGQDFVGKLYYYTVDDQGNDSYVENGNKYYSEEVVVYNDEALGL